MKRFISVLASLVLVATVVAVRSVKAYYLGDLLRCCPYGFEVQGTTKMSVTMLSLTSKGRLDVEEVLVLDGNTVNSQVRTLPRTADRLIFKLDTPPNSGGAVFRIGQSQKFEIPVDGHEEVVFDVIP
jgi:hypothetical protein